MMTVLDQFAAMAMTTLIGRHSDDYVAERSYEIAKAMMVEREKHIPRDVGFCIQFDKSTGMGYCSEGSGI